MNQNKKTPLWLVRLVQVTILAFFIVGWIQSAKKHRELQRQVDAVNKASVYKINNPSSRPLWPIPGFDRSEVHHLVMEVFPLEGSGLPHQVHVLKNVESGINEVGIMVHPTGFHQGAILETKVGEIDVLGEEEADAVLRKFGRK
ncbi:MAG: hypothetical protein QG585_504 [Patescibacteria group bacterium]|jgi:hypothetical protein|nr:hypothetical protein [Patescibacteria group bacterium]